jgi:uncharacterized protein (DUF952 family)
LSKIQQLLYHITTKAEWEPSKGQAHYTPLSFDREGFIHASRFHQLPGVLERYYSGRNDLMLLKIDEQKLACQLIYEPSATRELFPHIYGQLNQDAIVEVISPFNLEIFNSLNSFR